MADTYSQEGNRLKINTVLDAQKKANQSDPFLLVAVDGEEHVSKPFEYTLTVWRDATLGHAFAEALINTKAMFGILISETTERQQDQGPDTQPLQITASLQSYAYRCGIIVKFVYENYIDDRFFQYKITLIPYFKILDFETCYRIYEQKTFVDIIDDFVNIFHPDLLINTGRLDKSKFPKMEYCVQFGESSFNFLSRLMHRFGVWYYLEHDPKTQTNTLVLGQLNTQFNFSDIKINDPENKITDVNVSQLVLRVKQQSLLSITNFEYLYSPTIRWVRTGDFNILDPKSYYTGSSPIDASHDLFDPATHRGTKPGARTPPSDLSRFKTETFPQSAEANKEATDDANEDLWPVEAQTIVVKGSSRNPTFLPGYEYHLVGTLPRGVKPHDSTSPDIDEDLDASQAKQGQAPAVKDFVIFYNKLASKEDAYLGHPGVWGSLGDFFSKFWNNLVGKNDPADVLANFTNQGMNNYLQNQLPLNFGQPRNYPGQEPNPPPYFAPYFFGGGLAAASALVPALVSTIKDEISGPDNSFSNSFSSIPLDWTSPPRSLPVPTEFKNPVAAGPHLAVVINQQGTQKPYNNVYTDALGRVRVRFPWQWLGVDPRNNQVDPRKWTTDDVTCWVRPSHAWAGRHYGWQHVPRVGEEVVVSFIAGDPDRPIITGRVYNADDAGNNNPPFIQQSNIKTMADLPPTATNTITYQPYGGLKTNSMPTFDASGSPLPARYHLLRFDDTRGKEQYLIRSQRRLDITAIERRYESIGSDRHLTVGGKCVPKHTIGGDYISKIYRHYYLHVGDPDFPVESGNRSTKLEQNDYIHVVKNSGQQVDGSWSVTTGGQATIDANGMESGGIIVLNSLVNTTLSCGTSAIVITPMGVSITAPVINLVGQVLGSPPDPTPSPQSLPAMPPIDATNIPLVEPTAADPGNTLNPPKE
jgi:uncharacterized protein involved in type VI secretion and phage assembly